jgi:hypothetical protein
VTLAYPNTVRVAPLVHGDLLRTLAQALAALERMHLQEGQQRALGWLLGAGLLGLLLLAGQEQG